MKAGMQTKIIFYENICKTYDSHQLTPCVHSARLHRFQQRNCRPSCVLVFSSAHPLSVLPYRALCGSDAKLLTWPHSVTNTQQSLFRVHHKQVQMYYRSGIATCYCIGAGRHLVFTHQVVALFCMKWCHGEQPENVTSNRKSYHVNWCVFIQKSFLPNLVPIWFETDFLRLPQEDDDDDDE